MEQYTTVDHRSTLTCRLGALGRLEQLTDRLLLGEESQCTTTSSSTVQDGHHSVKVHLSQHRMKTPGLQGWFELCLISLYGVAC